MELIKIKNWDRYYPRKDVKSSSWFRMQIDFFIDPKFFNESIETKLVWIYILSESGRVYKDEIQFNVALCSSILRVDTHDIMASLESLESLGVVTRPNPTKSDRIVVLRNETERNVTRHNETKEYVAAKAPTSPKYSAWDLETAQILKDKIIASNPDAKKAPKTDPKKWADYFRLMRTIDGVKEERIREVLDWLFSGKCFYAANIQSADKFRKRWDYITGLMNEKKTKTDTKDGFQRDDDPDEEIRRMEKNVKDRMSARGIHDNT